VTAPYWTSHDGRTVLYAGDALDILPQLPAGSAQAVLTDPPYVIGAVSAGNLVSKAGGWADTMNSALWFATWYRQARRILVHTGVMWTCLNWRSVPVVMRAAADIGWAVTSMAVWDKQWIATGGMRGLRPSYELVAMLAKPGFAVPDRAVADVWRIKASAHKPSGHPAEKPVALMRRCLEVSCLPPGSMVVDPFLGSGTTAVACQQLGLSFLGIEAEERYIEMAARRLSQGMLDLDGPA
jgi:site-specific DNA-methyltransferase (adenine-specific)